MGVKARRPPARRVQLRLLAHARSGDKGDTANVGLIALKPEYYDLLRRTVTAARVAVDSALALDAALWKPIRAAKPERGCKYRKGPVVATVLLKSGKSLAIVANADDLGIPLATDPRPVRVELRHGDVRHCLEFGGTGKHKPGKKLLARNAPGAAACPGGSASGAFVD